MEKTSIQKLAGVLKLLVTITFICNLVALFLVPGCSRLRSLDELVEGALYFSNESSLAVAARMVGYFVSAWQEVWLFGGPYAAVLTSFLLFCGVCTAVILWQEMCIRDRSSSSRYRVTGSDREERGYWAMTSLFKTTVAVKKFPGAGRKR